MARAGGAGEGAGRSRRWLMNLLEPGAGAGSGRAGWLNL